MVRDRSRRPEAKARALTLRAARRRKSALLFLILLAEAR